VVSGVRELVLETAGFPDLNLVAETDERHCLGNARLSLQVLAQHHTPLAVDLQRLAGPVQRESKLFALVGEWCVAPDQSLDLRHERAPPCVDRRAIQCRVAIQALEAAATENRAIRTSHRHAPL